MYYGEIKNRDIANGIGVRVTLFVSGCRNCCPGCFNKMTWDFNYGQEYTEETEEEIIRLLKPASRWESHSVITSASYLENRKKEGPIMKTSFR